MIHIDTSQSPAPTPRPARPVKGILACPFLVLVDTREQAPWTFQGIIHDNRELVVRRQTTSLPTGDYSIEGHDSSIVIERKSGDDFLGSLGAGHARFRREHERMLEIIEKGGYAAVVVEDCLSRLLNELEAGENGRKMAPESVVGVVASWPQKYRVHYLFAGSRRTAEVVTIRMLWKFWEKVEKAKKQPEPEQPDLF